MFQDKMVLCASSAYEKKFYLNENHMNIGREKGRTQCGLPFSLPIEIEAG